MGAGGTTIKRGGSLNNYMYYGDYEQGDFFAEDLNFKDEKNTAAALSKASPRPATETPSPRSRT